MFFGLAGMIVVIVAMLVVPAGIYASIRLVNRIFNVAAPERVPPSVHLDARLRRMEEAIDAMSQQIERMRTSAGYVSRGADDMPLLPPSDDPQTFS
jgi:hypothetical protein